MTSDHATSAIAAIKRLRDDLGDRASFRVRVLLQMLSKALEADLAGGLPEDRDAQASGAEEPCPAVAQETVVRETAMQEVVAQEAGDLRRPAS